MFQLISNENKAFFLWVRVRVIFWQCEPEPYEPKILRTFTEPEPELKVRDTSSNVQIQHSLSLNQQSSFDIMSDHNNLNKGRREDFEH
jgi:hypothetical protein